MPSGAPGKKVEKKVEGNPWLAPLLVIVVGVAVCSGVFGLVGVVVRKFEKGEWQVPVGIAAAAALAGWIYWATRPPQMRRWKRRFGLAPGVKELARRLGVREADIEKHRPSYREVRIPKKSGGQRVLHVPDDVTKALQRRILHRLLARMKSHDAAYGFERGRSIAHNAAQHVGRAIVLRFDVVDFFPSTKVDRIRALFVRYGWSDAAVEVLVRLVTHAGGLPQGAPTSPRLSNLVNVGLDEELGWWISRREGRYTRYADDVTISFPENWIGEPERTGAAVREAFSRRGYKVHGKEKTSVRRRHQRQLVNGLVVNAKVALPRELRRRLRAARHHVRTGRACTFTPDQLKGWDAFESMVREQGAEIPEPWDRASPGWKSTRRRP